MNIKALIASLVLSATAIPAVAAPTYEDKATIDEHIELLNTLDDMGITVSINGPECGRTNDDVAGYWNGSRRLFVLCQEVMRNSKLPTWDGTVVLASDDDLDTIRHEAHHIIQDCVDGKIDGNLRVYLSPENSVEFLNLYPDWKEEYITKQYRASGANDHVIRLEIEAWAVADMVQAPLIHETLQRECKA